MKRTISLLAMLLLLTVLGMPDGAAQTPTPAQMEMFRQLPPAEQERLMREYGGQARRPQADETRARDRADPRQTREAWDNGEPRRAEPVIDPATGLVLFGYGMFRGAPEAFAPVVDIPVPTDYVLGPGDVIQVQLLGRTPGAYTLAVNRDGAVDFPDLGPISVVGLTFDHARQLMQERVAQQMIGVSASITMGELRSIRVFVLGDVEHPGSYSVSSLSTMTHALLVSGGISPIGSLRNVQLRRNGDLVAALDLYDLVLRGDNSNDARLKAGDVIFVPPVGPQVGVDGEVRRPGMYELRGIATADELVSLAGGLSPAAFPRGATLERIDERRERIVEDLDLSASEGRTRVLRAGDLLMVPSVLERVDNAVELVGHVFRPTRVQYRPGMRITDLVPSLRELKPLADAHYLLIRRELAPDRRVVALSADLAQALRTPGSEADVSLQPGDRVHVFSLAPVERPGLTMPGAADTGMEWLESDQAQVQNQQAGRAVGSAGPADDRSERDLQPESEEEKQAAEELRIALEADRQTVVEELIVELRLQATHDATAPLVRVDGRVRAPGVYPLEPGMRVSDLLRAGGSLAESAYITSAEITRYEVVGGEYREAELIEVDLAGIRAGSRDADLALQSFDFLNIKEVTAWREQEAVTVRGEVRFPGTYPIRRGETLASVVERAGGLTDRAFPDGAIFTRIRLRQREGQQVRELTQRMEADLAVLSVQAAQGGEQSAQTIAAGQSLLAELRSVQPVGRLAIDLPSVLRKRPGSPGELVLEDGDVLMVPGVIQSVTILGEVQSPTSLLFDPSLDRDQYIARSGGMTRRADANRIYIVRANGLVEASGSRRWFNASQMQVQPGDTIVVPADIERMRPIPLWSAVTSIIFNLAVAVAAVNSF